MMSGVALNLRVFGYTFYPRRFTSCFPDQLVHVFDEIVQEQFRLPFRFTFPQPQDRECIATVLTLSLLRSCFARGNARRIGSRCSATGKDFVAVGAVSFQLFLVVLKPGAG